MRVFLLEDEHAIHKTIETYLAQKGIAVDGFYDGEAALEAIRQNYYDLAIVDINVPSASGLEVLSEAKRIWPASPVIIISSNVDIESITNAYEGGCDEYLKKPFHIKELEIKIDRLMEDRATVVSLGHHYMYDKQKRTLFCGEEAIDLTRKEMLFIHLLASNLGNIVSYEKIEYFIWGDKLVNQTALRALVKRLRKKVDKEIVKNVIGIGYRIDKP